MTVKPNAEEVRLIVLQYFLQLGVKLDDADEIDETLRISNGKLAARSYRAGGFFAMWLVDVGILQFYDQEGNMLRTVNLFATLSSSKMAA